MGEEESYTERDGFAQSVASVEPYAPQQVIAGEGADNTVVEEGMEEAVEAALTLNEEDSIGSSLSTPEQAPSPEPVSSAGTASPGVAAEPAEPRRSEGPHMRPSRRAAGSDPASLTLSYRARVILTCVAISFLTVTLSLGMVALIWNQFFSTYAANNIETLAQQTANRIADLYQKTLTLEGDTLIPAREAADSSDELGVMVVSAKGNKLFDSTDGLSPEEAAKQGPSAATQIAIAPIEVADSDVGNVRVWVYGSNTLMSKVDRQFQMDTFLALLVAGGIALVFALLFGMIFVKSLVWPLDRITRTARELSEGNLSARTGISGSDELSRLAETMDDMAESFQRDRKLEQQLTSDVAHELRTPLMAIQANVEAMIDGVYEKDEEHLMLVDAEVGRLSKLVDGLLKLSRLEMRTTPMREEPVDLTALAVDVVSSHEAFIEDCGISISLGAQQDVKTLGDADMIRQAVTNLVSNAIRYTDEGGSITISVFREGRMAAIAVQDTGIGLSPEEEKMVFSRFWRADSGRAKESGGLGIGLSLVKEIVDRHHGRVAVKGTKGVGATFTLYFPLYDEERSLAQARVAVKVMEKRQRNAQR